MPEHNPQNAPTPRPPKKAKKATAFPPRRPKPAGVFDSVIAGADEVAENAFKAQTGTRSPDAATASNPVSAPSAAADLPVQQQPASQGALASVPVALVAPETDRRPVPDADLSSPPVPSRSVDLVMDAPAPAAAAEPESEPQPASDLASKSAPNRDGVLSIQKAAAPVAARGFAVATGEGTAPQRAHSQGWAHQSVRESFADAKIHSHRWGMHGFRITPDVLASLKKRVARDRRTSGNSQLAIGHYLDAALRHAPSEIDEQVSSAQAFLAERMGFVEAGVQSTYRIGPQAQAFAAELNLALQEANYSRKGVYVVSAAVTQLLRAMDAEGDLHRPAPPVI